MKKIFLAFFVIMILFLAFQIGKYYFFSQGPRTFVTMYEGAASVYRLDGGEREYLGMLEKGESITISSRSGGPFAVLNVMRFFVPQAVAIFKTTVGKFSTNKPLGVFKYLFTEEAFEQNITRKLKKSWIPDAKVTINPDGFKATATLILPNNKAIPVYASGIVGVDKKKHGTMYVRFYEARIGKFRFPKLLLDWVAKASDVFMGKGSFEIEILDMEYRPGGIFITYRKVEPEVSLKNIKEKGFLSDQAIPEKLDETAQQSLSM
jgi:hypothetical protein